MLHNSSCIYEDCCTGRTDSVRCPLKPRSNKTPILSGLMSWKCPHIWQQLLFLAGNKSGDDSNYANYYDNKPTYCDLFSVMMSCCYAPRQLKNTNHELYCCLIETVLSGSAHNLKVLEGTRCQTVRRREDFSLKAKLRSFISMWGIN